MFRVRSEQFDALAAAVESDVREAIATTMWLRRNEFTGLPDRAYVGRLVDDVVARCRARGLDRRDTWAGCVESLLKDDEHPMAMSRLDAKFETVMRELDAQRAYSLLQARAVALAPAAPR